MATENAALDKIMFVSDFDPAHYNWTPQELKALGDVRLMAEVIVARFKAHNIIIDSYYAIKHDGDTKNCFWLPSKRNEKEPKFKEYQKEIRAHEHTHQLLFFNKDTKVDRYKAAEIMGVSPLTIDKIHSKDGCLAYLCHSKYEKKFQYPKTAVQTIAGEDFSSIYDANYEKWYDSRYRVKVKEFTIKKANKALFQDAKRRFIDGEITYEEIFTIDEYHSMISETYYYNQLKKLKDTQEEIDKTNKNNLIKKIKAEKLLEINPEELNHLSKRAYFQFQTDIDNECRKNIKEKLLDASLSIEDIISNEKYFQVVISERNPTTLQRIIDQIESLIISGEISSIDEINNNKLYSFIYNNIVDFHYKNSVSTTTGKKIIDELFYNSLCEQAEKETIDLKKLTKNSYFYELITNARETKCICYEYHADPLTKLIIELICKKIDNNEINTLKQLERIPIYNDIYKFLISFAYYEHPLKITLSESLKRLK